MSETISYLIASNIGVIGIYFALSKNVKEIKRLVFVSMYQILLCAGIFVLT